uniref:Uncharacterized protein n=2 Tax=Aegilops tauschii subsp. strangulata TaxID=200361 RepID=A0A453RG35_AEGTS
IRSLWKLTTRAQPDAKFVGARKQQPEQEADQNSPRLKIRTAQKPAKRRKKESHGANRTSKKDPCTDRGRSQGGGRTRDGPGQDKKRRAWSPHLKQREDEEETGGGEDRKKDFGGETRRRSGGGGGGDGGGGRVVGRW